MNTKVVSTLKTVLCAVCAVVIFAAMFSFAQAVLVRKTPLEKGHTNAQTSYWQEYRSLEKDTVDVLYVGSSIVYCNVDPMLIYNETGITSYNISCASMHYDQAYLALKEALKTQSPKVVMLEASPIKYETDADEAHYHALTDNLTITPETLQVIAENDWTEQEKDLLGFAFPLFRYHDRWSDISKYDIKVALEGVAESYQRGHCFTFTSKEVELDYYTPKEDWSVRPRTIKYLDKIADLCQEQGIKLVFFKTPAKRWNITYSQAMSDYAESRGLEFYDFTFELDEIGIDTSTDFRDEIGHLNQYGAEKFSQYLCSNYLPSLGLPDHRGTETNWDADYLNYQEALADAKQKAENKSSAK